MKRTLLIVLLTAGLAGCRNGTQSSLWEQIGRLSDERTELSLEVQRLERENAALAEQVQTLTGLDSEDRMAGLVTPQRIRIGRHTGLYDKTRDGQPDSLVVYLEPLDATQDVIKAAGAVNVELWDLAAPPEQAKAARWTVGAKELKTLWGRGLTGAYYRLIFPLDDLAQRDTKQWTLAVQFTDYLTGKILNDQQIISRFPERD